MFRSTAPAVVNGLWIGPSLGPIERLSIASFLKRGHAYHLYCYDPVAGVPAGATVRDANEVLPESSVFRYEGGPGRGSVSAFSNLFRYKFLLDRGGWWVDTDVVCVKPFTFRDPVVLANERTREGTQLATAIIRLPPGHEVARRCYEAARDDAARAETWGKTGPLLFTEVVRELKLEGRAWEPAVFCPIPWWDWETILSDGGRGRAALRRRTRAVHLWHEMWRRAGVERNAVPTKGSLFAELLDRFGVERGTPAGDGGR